MYTLNDSNVSNEKFSLKNLNGGTVLKNANKSQVFDFLSSWPAREYRVEKKNTSTNSTIFYHKHTHKI